MACESSFLLVMRYKYFKPFPCQGGGTLLLALKTPPDEIFGSTPTSVREATTSRSNSVISVIQSQKTGSVTSGGIIYDRPFGSQSRHSRSRISTRCISLTAEHMRHQHDTCTLQLAKSSRSSVSPAPGRPG